jgi:hypothetical protein
MRPSNTTPNAKTTSIAGSTGPQTRNRPAFPLVSLGMEPPAGIEPATPSLPWNHQEPLCGPPFPQVAPDRRGQSYRFSFGEVMRSLFSHVVIVLERPIIPPAITELSPHSFIDRS